MATNEVLNSPAPDVEVPGRVPEWRLPGPPAQPSPETPGARPDEPAAARADRWTVAGGIALLTILVLHTAVFAANPHWAQWLGGPTRDVALSTDATLLFWAVAGGFVLPGAILALMLIGLGRRGETARPWIPVMLLCWAALCVWIVGGPTGFMLAVVPAALLLIGRARRRR